MTATVVVHPGSWFSLDGEAVEVVALDGAQVTVRDASQRWQALGMAGFLAAAVPLEVPEVSVLPAGPLLAGLADDERAGLAERAGHVREMLTGFRSGTAEVPRPGEPRPEFDPVLPVAERERAKARELGVSARTVRRWARAYRDGGEAALVDERKITGRGSVVDPRWEEACRVVLAEHARESTPTASAVLRVAAARLDEEHGPGVVPRPSAATAYRHLGRITKGTNAVKGSAKGRRSIADRPKGVYGRLRAVRPGEYVILDTQDLDVFAMEPVTCRWVGVQLTVAQDLFTRCITGLRVTPVSTKAVDVAGILYQAVAPRPAPADWPAEACWPYHGVPQHLVFTEEGRPPAGPVCPPETLVIDHGKAFLSAHVISVCTRLGISIQPAQPKKPTDKPTLERFFKTLREGLIQHLPAYKGPDVHSRGEDVEDAAFFYLHELEDIIREWIALVYHRSPHDGLVVPQWPRLKLSPNQMYEIGLAKAGLLRIPATPQLAYEFFEVHPRTIQHYGVEVGGLRYNGPALDPYRNTDSPYGGVHAGRWPIRINPDDVRYACFQDPADDCWHRLEWEHAPGLGTPFSAEAALHARRLAAAQDRWPDPAQALDDLLARWDKGMVTGRRERRMAARLAAERSALPLPAGPGQDTGLAVVPGTGPGLAEPGAPAAGDDDDPAEIFDAPADGDFYADAFEVLE
ncbi:MAG TPA: helix-turn-helix domain-containing protein [Streptosporangiaceae bacterium]